MKNITVSLDDETYRRARIRAAERETSVSALVKNFLAGLAGEMSDNERRKLNERALRQLIAGYGFSAGDRLPREDLHNRKS
jgi:plasmid stability protein